MAKSQLVTGAAEALKDLGNAQKAAGSLQEAIASYRRSLETEPDYIPALYNLGLALRELERFDEAEACFRRVVEIDFLDVDALLHLGALLRRRMQLVEAGQTFRRALRLAPENAHLWMHLGDAGVASFTEGSLRESEKCFRKAVELRPDLGDAHHALGNVHSLNGRHDEALRSHREALRLQPDSAAFRAAVLTEMQRLCDWGRLDELCGQLRQSVVAQPGQPVHPFNLLSIPSTRAEQLACAQNYSRAIAAAVSRQRQRLDFRFDRPRKPRRRIGYLSAEFHLHATAFLAAELFELHDRGRFEVFAYSYGPDERSPIRGRLERAFDRFVDIRALSDVEAARAIHGDEIDILVDLKGYTFRARSEIVALRPAPLQVSYLGYPGTMGAEFVDYLVGDCFVTPPAHAEHYGEKLVLMPASYQVNDRRRAVGPTPSRQAMGLPEQGVVFCCFNQSYKILPRVFAAWMRMLQAVPGSVLWFLEWNSSAPRNLRSEAVKLGIDPGRLFFSPTTSLESHLARMRLADLFLDTFPCNAHTTASDALWAGLPLLTCAGDTFASRVAGSLLHAVGLTELVARSLAEYEALGIRLARGRDQLAALRAKLVRDRDSAALFDTPRFVRHLETAYEEMWRIHVSAGKPRLIEV